MPDSIPERLTQYKRRLAELEEDARSWQTTWTEVQTNVLPNMGRLKGPGERPNDGKKKNTAIVNASPTRACYELAAGMHNHMCSPVKDWFRLALEEKDLLELPLVRPWLETCTKKIRSAFLKSNFYDVALSILRELGGFGTGCFICDETPRGKSNFVPLTIGEYYLALDPALHPDTLFRRFVLTVSQLVREFGIDNVSDTARRAFEKKNWIMRVTVVHVIQPRMTNELERGNPKRMAWESVYFEETESAKVLRESGYESYADVIGENVPPFAAPRWAPTSTDTYGRGPFIDNMPDIKGLQWWERKKYEAIDKLINPPMNVPSVFKNQGGASIAPGAQNIADGPQGEGLRPTIEIANYPLQHVTVEIENLTNRIRENSFVTLFRIISNIERQMTATEVRQRIVEGLTLLGPVVMQTQGGMFDVAIKRTFGHLWFRGEIPPPPPVLRGHEWTIEYTGFLAQAQRAADSGVLEQFVDSLTKIITAQSITGAYPEALDKVDCDQIVDELGDMLGVPARIIRSDAEVQAMRDRRQAAQQQAAALAQMQAMEPVARAAKTASETRVEGGRQSMLDALSGGT